MHDNDLSDGFFCCHVSLVKDTHELVFFIYNLRIQLNWPRGYKTFSCSAQLSMKFFMLINVKIQTIVGISTIDEQEKLHSQLI